MAKFLVTGAAGFIGYHVALRLLQEGDTVIGVDNLNDYYDVALKQARLARLSSRAGFGFMRADVADTAAMMGLFEKEKFEFVIHLAAQAGVRYSLQNPHAYVQSNLVGFTNILEGCRHHDVRHLVYASSSSVYGGDTALPFSEHRGTNHPISLYGATKKANEVMAHSYSHLFRLPTTGLRFFTVYGPWGRPDMAMFLFAKAIIEGRPIELFNDGKMRRDFTYIDDVVEGVVRVARRPATVNPDFRPDVPDPASSTAPYRLYNIGNNHPVDLLRLVELLEKHLGKAARVVLAPLHPSDLVATMADVTDLTRDVGFKPGTPIEEGIRRFCEWYLQFHGQ